MNFKLTTLWVLTSFLISCANNDDNGKNKGLNLSGSWKFAGVECYDREFTRATAAAIPSPDSPMSNFTIEGDLLKSEDVTDSCNVRMNRKFSASLIDGDGENGYGTGTLGEAFATVSPNAPCSLAGSFQMLLGSITPSTLNTTYSDGQLIPEQSFEFLVNNGFLAISSVLKVVGRPSDVCLLLYKK